MAKTKTTPTTAYLKPILEAAALLNIKVHSHAIEQLSGVLDKLGREFPGDVLRPVHALAMLDGGMMGTVEELEILDRVWPGYSGSTRYKLTPTTLTWQWSSKHTARYATITVPFPTILPMQVTVERFCDMDEPVNHSDYCTEEDRDVGQCNCDGFIEQTVVATVKEWDAKTETALAVWLERAIDGPMVKPITLGKAGK